MNYFYLIALCLCLLSLKQDAKIELINKHQLRIKEPSDICVSPDNHLFIVSDNGNLYKTDLQGKIVATSTYEGYDFEAVCCDKNYIYVSEESNRKISVFDFELKYLKSYILAYQGGRNKGFEAMCFNEKTNTFTLISEKDPSVRRTYNKDFSSFDEVEMKNFSDVSSLTFHNNFYWILSDEEHTVFQFDINFELKNKIKLPILNPEGITFLDNETFLILSDDMQVMYTYKLKQ
jgi:uncharacterized protein YjiK